MAVLLGHAISNENQKAKGGKKGDQTCKEVLIANWYLHKKGWIVIRPKNAEVAEKIARCMEMICQNENFGYGQDYRSSGFNEAKKHNYDPSKVKVKCGIDCSMAVRLCLHYAGIKCDSFVTNTQIKILKPLGKFTFLTSDKYCKSSKYLKRGDILLTASTPGHTAVILSDGEEIVKEKQAQVNANKTEDKKDKEAYKVKYNEAKVKIAKYYSKSVKGTYKTTCRLNLRYGAGTSNDKILKIPKGEKVKCYGYYNKVLKTKWYLVEYGDYVGYCSSKYLTK